MNSKINYGRIIVIDDVQEMRSLLMDFLTNSGFAVLSFNNPVEFLEKTKNATCLPNSNDRLNMDLIISDIKMPFMTGLEFTEKMKKIRPEVPIILITAFGSIETAIEAMKMGAFHYIVKPFKLAELSVNIERALETSQLRQENVLLKQEIKKNWAVGNIIGKSEPMIEVFDLISRVAQANANVLITGESGTGKELVARAIHQSGSRTNKPFIAINCTAIPEALLESELFGHAKGSFTGAVAKKIGLFEEANGGTLFLDEIGDMNTSLQAKLLRVIQERKIRPVGDNETRDIDVRIIAATHKDLKAAIKEGNFREDLYYRLSVIPIVIPPLRHRKEDIPLLAEHFLKKYAAMNSSIVKGFTPEAIQKLLGMRWEGNVRELENVIERAVVLTTGSMIDSKDIPSSDTNNFDSFYSNSIQTLPDLAELEKRYIHFVLEKTGGRKDKTSQILGINRRTLYRKQKEYGMHAEDHPDDSPIEDV